MSTIAPATAGKESEFKRQQLTSTIGAGLLMILASILIGFGFTVTTGMERFGVSAAEYTGWLTVMSLAAAASFAVVGMLVRKVPIRMIIAISGLIASGSVVGMAFAPSILWMYIWALPFGIGFGGCSFLAANTLIADWHSHARKGTVLGFVATGVGIGGFTWGFIFPPVVVSGGFSGTMLLIAAIVFSCSVINSLVLIRTAPRRGVTLAGDESANTQRAPLTGLKVVVFLLVLACVVLAFEGAWPAMMPAALQADGLDLTTVGNLVSVWAFASIITSPLLGYITDRFGMRVAYVMVSVMFVVSLPGIALFGHLGVWVYFMLVPVLAFAMSVNSVLLPMFTRAAVGTDRFSQVYGYMLSAVLVSNSLAVPVWGLCFDTTGSYHLAMIGAGFAGLIGMTLVAIAPAVARRSRGPLAEAAVKEAAK